MATPPIDAESPVTLPCAWLPDDLVVNIFARLPAKSAGRCRCLSRAWAARLSSGDFAECHSRLANRRGSPRVFFLPYSFHDGPQILRWSQDLPSGESSRMDVPRPTNGNTLRSNDEGLRPPWETFSTHGPVFQRQYPLLIVPLICRILRYVRRLLYGAPVLQSYAPCLVGQSHSATADYAPPPPTARLSRSHGGPLHLATLQCRGLVVLQDAGTKINYLCNPSTGQMAALPVTQGQEMWHEDVAHRRYASLGLGYDVHTQKHKVVRFCYQGRDLQGLPRSAGCEVYVVNSVQGRWRTIRAKPPAWVKYNRPSVSVQGHLHWLAHRKFNISDGRPVEMTVVTFSLADHVFGTVAPPLGMEGESSSNKYELTELDNHVCLFSCGVSRSSCYDIWLLQPEHGAHVWNLHCRIDLSKVSPEITDRFARYRLHPLAIINNGSRILLLQLRPAFNEKSSRLCAYDPVTGDVEDIFNGSNMASIDAAVYEESIVSFW